MGYYFLTGNRPLSPLSGVESWDNISDNFIPFFFQLLICFLMTMLFFFSFFFNFLNWVWYKLFSNILEILIDCDVFAFSLYCWNLHSFIVHFTNMYKVGNWTCWYSLIEPNVFAKFFCFWHVVGIMSSMCLKSLNFCIQLVLVPILWNYNSCARGFYT